MNPNLENEIKDAVSINFGPVDNVQIFNYRDFMNGYGDSLEK